MTASSAERFPSVGFDALDNPGGVAALAGHVVLHGADLAAAVSDRLRAPVLERVDRSRRLRPGLGDDEADAALEGELAQVVFTSNSHVGPDLEMELFMLGPAPASV